MSLTSPTQPSATPSPLEEGLPPHMLEELPPSAELVEVAQAELVETVPAAAPSMPAPPPMEAPRPAAATAMQAVPSSQAPAARPTPAASPRARKYLREKLRAAATQEALTAAVEYGHAAGVEDVASEVERIGQERRAAARSPRARTAALEWSELAGEVVRCARLPSPVAAPPVPEAQEEAEPLPAAEGMEASDGASAPLPPRPAPAVFMGQPVAAVSAWSEVVAPYVEALAGWTRGRGLDLSKEVDVTVMRGTPHERRVTGDVKGRLTTLVAVVLSENLSLGAGGEGEGEERTSAFWEAFAITGTLALSAIPSPLAALEKAAGTFVRGSIGAARVVGGLFRRGRRP